MYPVRLMVYNTGGLPPLNATTAMRDQDQPAMYLEATGHATATLRRLLPSCFKKSKNLSPGINSEGRTFGSTWIQLLLLVELSESTVQPRSWKMHSSLQRLAHVPRKGYVGPVFLLVCESFNLLPVQQGWFQDLAPRIHGNILNTRSVMTYQELVLNASSGNICCVARQRD